MDCARFESIVHEIERPGTEGFALRERAFEHAESCDRCARLMMETESLDAGLRALMAAASAQEAPPRVEAGLLAEMRRQKAVVAQRRVRRQVAALSTAAVALLAAGLSLHYWKGSGGGSNRPESPAENPARANGAATTGSPNVIEMDDTAYASSFRPLPYADDPSALEDGAVVQVEMPRAALASFGLPVAAMESDGTVRADLIVSADGTPQAIRLVPQNGTSPE
jgi:hypothetical protein